MQTSSIKEQHRAKLRLLRDEIAHENNIKERKVKALKNAEQMELNWELMKLGVRPLKGRR